MKFKYRLGYYMVGFSMGLFVVAMIWNGKNTSCNYFPNARVLKNIRTKPFYYSDEARQVLAQPWLDTMDVVNTFHTGDVDFDRSNVRLENGKLYVIESKTKQDVPFEVEVVNYENRAVLKNIIKK